MCVTRQPVTQRALACWWQCFRAHIQLVKLDPPFGTMLNPCSNPVHVLVCTGSQTLAHQTHLETGFSNSKVLPAELGKCCLLAGHPQPPARWEDAGTRPCVCIALSSDGADELRSEGTFSVKGNNHTHQLWTLYNGSHKGLVSDVRPGFACHRPTDRDPK